jgi:carboxylesterase type B
MMDYLAKFARSGNPNGKGLPVWRVWSNNEGKSKAIVFDADATAFEIGMTPEEVTSDKVRNAYYYSWGVAGYLTEIFNWYPWNY